MSKAITVLVGSTRKGSFHKVIAENLPKIAPNVTFTVFQELDRIPFYNYDLQQEKGLPEEVQKISASIRSSDAVILLSPEYNYSFTAVLKNAIDWLSRDPEAPLAKKKVGIQSGSLGLIGGARGQYQLRQVLVFLDSYVINKPEVILPSFMANIDLETREIKSDIYKTSIKNQIEALLA